MSTKRKKRDSRAALVILIVVTILLIIIVGGYTTIKSTFDPKYEDLIKQYSTEYGLDEAFVTSVIWTESRFDSDAKSHANAEGLMQLMPETAKWVAGKIGLDANEIDVKDPETNIRLGCWYLHYLSNEFNDVRDTVAAAYNAGHNTVDKWLANSAYSSDGKTLDSIPYPETEQYVKKINIAYKVYTTLYSF